MKKITYLMVIVVFLMSGCIKKELPTTSDEIYHFTGKFIGLVDQKGNNLDGLKINYTVSLHDFNPSGKEFEIYNSEYPKDSNEKHIHITDNTKIYKQSYSESITPTSIELGSKIDFKVRIVNKHILEAVEINIINN